MCKLFAHPGCCILTTYLLARRGTPNTAMHAGSFSVNRRWRAQNGTGAAAFGGVRRRGS